MNIVFDKLLKMINYINAYIIVCVFVYVCMNKYYINK